MRASQTCVHVRFHHLERAPGGRGSHCMLVASGRGLNDSWGSGVSGGAVGGGGGAFTPDSGHTIPRWQVQES